MVGKKAAFATPMLAFAAAMRRSAAEISGLRSSNSEGKPGGMKGGTVESACSETRNVEAGWPTNNARVCSNCVRWSMTAGNCACVVFSTVSAWATSRSDTAPPARRLRVNCSDLVKTSTLEFRTAFCVSNVRNVK